MNHIVIAASKDKPIPETELESIRKSLAPRQVAVASASWEDPSICWQMFDLLIMCGVWSYPEKIEEFRLWLRQLEAKGIKVENPIELIKWNMDKKYLLDLSSRGLPVIDTAVVDSKSLNLDIVSDVAKANGWQDIVIKPSIGSSSHLCYRLTQDSNSGIYLSNDDIDFQAYHAASDQALIQPYISTILTEGEWSIVMIDGHYSHTVRARPVGDFRAWDAPRQVCETDPAKELVVLAEEAISLLAERPLYARVDMIRDPATNKYLVSELEVIEPRLFLTKSSRGLTMFVNGILGRLGRQTE